MRNKKQEINIRIYNTLTRGKDSLAEKNIGMYVCGPTVYDEPHIGHARSAYIFDMITRYLRFRGLKVTIVRNITDIDDKIIEKARQEIEANGVPMREAVLAQKVKEIAEKYLRRYHEDMALLGLDRPDIEPKATETIKDMVKFIQNLIDRGYAYEASGNVYFNVRKYNRYGELSGQSLDQMEEGARVALDKNKKDPLDFALWKNSKENEPFWESPWGNGRPGWHIECSVMSTKFLKDKFLIHGGGLDLVFPHHENEAAQTVCAGKRAAKYWIHNGLLTIDGQKMSKSLGNFITIGAFQAKYKDLGLLKLLFLSSHYRHPVDFTEEKLESVKQEKERMINFINNVQLETRGKDIILPKHLSKWEDEFLEAMDDDFNTPKALSVIFECINEGNRMLAEGKLDGQAYAELALSEIFIRKIVKEIFGLNLEYEIVEDSSIRNLINEREKAREKKDFKKADEIRSKLLTEGVVVEDTRGGPRIKWRKKL